MATRSDGLVITLNNETMGDDIATIATTCHVRWQPAGACRRGRGHRAEGVGAGLVTETKTTTPGTESVKNHGQFVKAQGGGKTAAQACAGMPLNSTQGSSILK